jgi:nitrous oxidase accessory protein
VTLRRLSWLAIAALLVTSPAVAPADPPRAIARPACTIELPAGTALDRELDRLPQGAVVCLSPGSYPGPIRITRKATLWGPPEAVVRSSGSGSTIEVTASGSELLGFSVDGSGGRFDKLDAAVRIHADDVRVSGLTITRAVFGLLVEQSRRAKLTSNSILGSAEGPLGMRGDPIRLWETRDSLIAGNNVVAGRDVVIWYSSGNRIVENRVSSGRYGTHLMYSHDNELRGNRYRHNVVGTFVMYSRNVRLADNWFLHSRGSAGVGIGLKESGNVAIERNLIVDSTVGVYIDTSPMTRGDRNRFADNAFLLNERAVVFHGRERANTFTDNLFRDNGRQLFVEGNADPSGSDWHGNSFDDYAGYDLDGDGRGDIPYEARSLSGDLIARRPELALLSGTPALWLIDALSKLVPLYAPRTLCVDRSPRLEPSPAVASMLGGLR